MRFAERAARIGGRVGRGLLGRRFGPVQRSFHRQEARRRARRDQGPDAAVVAAAREFVARWGMTVRAGPFAGLTYPDDALAQRSVVHKLLGAYELELHGAVEALVAADPRIVVNIGAGEGYYAVGLARRLPQAQVHAFDTAESERVACRALVRTNAVEERVHLAGLCDHARLEELSGPETAVVCDCEGCEVELLDPAVVPGLARSRLIVELHDFLDVRSGPTALERFSPTHDIEIVEACDRDVEAFPELEAVAERLRAPLLDEHRPGAMRWAVMVPRV